MHLYFQRRCPFLDGPGRRVLHFAPEACLVPWLRERFGDGYITADFNDPTADIAVNVMSIPFADETFDLICCSHVLEHVEDDRKAMREIRRVLKKAGIALFAVPLSEAPATFEDPSITRPSDRARAFGQHDHLRLYGADFATRLQESGFEIAVLGPEDLATPDEAAGMRIDRDAGVLHVCRRVR